MIIYLWLVGVCGYGFYGKMVNNGYFVGVFKFYKGGIGCGVCFYVSIFLI